MRERENGRRRACPDCGGSGKYVGLNVVEPCRACRGTGALTPPRIDVIKSRVLDHRLFELVLAKQGYEVCTYDSIGGYLHRMAAPPDCIIVGWFFRALGVGDLVAELEERSLNVPVIVSTSLALDPEELPVGVFALLPDHALGSEEYLEVIKRAVGQAAAQRGR